MICPICTLEHRVCDCEYAALLEELRNLDKKRLDGLRKVPILTESDKQFLAELLISID